MARKRILSTLDTSIAYEAVGLDLAKTDVALAAFDSDHKEPYFIDRIPYDKLYELLANMAPTLVFSFVNSLMYPGFEIPLHRACAI